MKPDVKLSTGRIVSHRPYLSNGEPNGATEAFIVGGHEMTSQEWQEYVEIISGNKKCPFTPLPKK
jgi:hypothetical protein